MTKLEKLQSIMKSFTPEQRAIYDEMLSDTVKLKAEWFLCNRMYAKAAKVVNDKDTGPDVRIVLRNATTDYWSRRRLALERMLECTGNNDMLVGWRNELNGQA